MNRITNLFLLINTMTKAEKRHFQLTSNLQKGKKGYAYLFEKLDTCDTPEEAYKAFCRKHGKQNIEATARYLYNQLMDCLIYLNRDTQVQNSIFRLIMQASVLYERRFISETFRTLSKAKQLATNYEQDILLMLIRRIEITYITETGFGEMSERELVSKHTKLIECQKITRSTNMHISLYSSLNYRLRYLDKIRSGQQKELMNDLVLSELNLISNNYYHGFESLKLHLLFQASYYLNTGSYKSAIRYYSELLDLFDEYEHLQEEPPIYYFTTLKGIIKSLFNAGIYDEIPVFIEKLKLLKKTGYPQDFLLKVEWMIFYAQVQHLLHTDKYEEAKLLCQESESFLLKKANSFYLETQLDLYIGLAVVYLYNNSPKQANKYIKKIYLNSKAFQIFPVFKTVRLLKLIIDAELGNYELLENDIRSIKRSLRKEAQAYKTEKVVFKFVLMYPLPKHEKLKSNLWKKLEKDILSIRENRYEQYLLNTFNFADWIESKLSTFL